MSKIPQRLVFHDRIVCFRKPDTPLTKFYALGKYEKPNISLDRVTVAKPVSYIKYLSF